MPTAATFRVVFLLGFATAVSAAEEPPPPCPGDRDSDGVVTIAEIVAAVNAALSGCPAAPTVTRTPVPSGARPTATATPPRLTPSPTRTPNQCEFDFDDEVFEDRTCVYTSRSIGDPSINCRGPFTLTWVSNGREVQVRIYDSSQRRETIVTGMRLSNLVADMGRDVSGSINIQKRFSLYRLPQSTAPPLLVGQCAVSYFDGQYAGYAPYRGVP